MFINSSGNFKDTLNELEKTKSELRDLRQHIDESSKSIRLDLIN